MIGNLKGRMSQTTPFVIEEMHHLPKTTCQPTCWPSAYASAFRLRSICAATTPGCDRTFWAKMSRYITGVSAATVLPVGETPEGMKK